MTVGSPSSSRAFGAPSKAGRPLFPRHLLGGSPRSRPPRPFRTGRPGTPRSQTPQAPPAARRGRRGGSSPVHLSFPHLSRAKQATPGPRDGPLEGPLPTPNRPGTHGHSRPGRGRAPAAALDPTGRGIRLSPHLRRGGSVLLGAFCLAWATLSTAEQTQCGHQLGHEPEPEDSSPAGNAPETLARPIRHNRRSNTPLRDQAETRGLN